MKTLYRFLLVAAFIPYSLTGGLFSGYDDEDEGCWEDAPASEISEACSNIFYLDFNADYIGSSKFSSPSEVRSDSLSYSGGDLTLSYFFFVNDSEALTLGVGYDWDHISWKENPYFDQTSFKRYHFDLDAFTYRLPGWIWRAGISVACDGDHWNLRDYALYNYSVWGRYSCPFELFPDLGLHIGLVGRVGIEKEWQQPLFGIDFSPCERWMVHLIYPIDLSIAYEWSDCWFVDVAYRSWNRRYRLDEDAVLSRGIIEYRNNGMELGGHYRYQEYLHAGIHLGHTFNVGEIVVHDRDNNNEGHYRQKSSFYFGGELVLCF